MDGNRAAEWFDDYAEGADETQVDEYDITATPNDFNVMTLHSFVESGAVRIPGFQRNFVWDIKRASKLIESLILGLPVPQLFLYEQSRNRFLVIDGQQRMMSIYYFMKKRFPKREKRVELRKVFDVEGRIPDEVFMDDEYFEPFQLTLPGTLPDTSGKFHGLDYDNLDEYRTQFDLRPIRNIVVKQTVPADDDSSMYEVFNRLNSGGINLAPQEIRASMYHSPFYEALRGLNLRPGWRRLLKSSEPDLHMKDVEILLRGFAMLIDQANYKPSMVRFLNQFSKKAEMHAERTNAYLEEVFDGFLDACDALPDDAFLNKRTTRFNLARYEAVFVAACRKAFDEHRRPNGVVRADELDALVDDSEFLSASVEGTTRKSNVDLRIERASKFITPL